MNTLIQLFSNCSNYFLLPGIGLMGTLPFYIFPRDWSSFLDNLLVFQNTLFHQSGNGTGRGISQPGQLSCCIIFICFQQYPQNLCLLIGFFTLFYNIFFYLIFFSIQLYNPNSLFLKLAGNNTGRDSSFDYI